MLSGMLFPLRLSGEGVTPGSENFLGSSVFTGLLCEVTLWLTQLMGTEKQEVLLMPNFPKFRSLASGFMLTSCAPCCAPATGGTGSPSTSCDWLLFSSCFFCRGATLNIIV